MIRWNIGAFSFHRVQLCIYQFVQGDRFDFDIYNDIVYTLKYYFVFFQVCF